MVFKMIIKPRDMGALLVVVLMMSAVPSAYGQMGITVSNMDELNSGM